MGNTSKDLLSLEHKRPSTSLLESSLLVCNKDSRSEAHKQDTGMKPTITTVPESQVKNFLEVILEANKKLEVDAKDNSQAYDIEVLTGNESQVIEMDLMLGVAGLQTAQAVAAAESAIAGCQPVIPLAASISGTDSDDFTDESYGTEESDEDDANDKCLGKITRKNHSKKWSRIIEVS